MESLRAAKASGVEAVTIGSDCHYVEGLVSKLWEATKRLETAGYSNICVYEGGRNRIRSIDEVRT